MNQLKQILASPKLEALFPLASVILQIATVKPHKRKRLSFIKWNHPELWKQMIDLEIVEAYEKEENSTEDLETFIYEEEWTDCRGFVEEPPAEEFSDDDPIPF
jgi:hypothetical protein